MSDTHVYSFIKDNAGVYRAIFPIKIINPTNNKAISVRALLDSGADDCLFPKFIADNLQYDLKGANAIFSSNQGIG